MYAHGIYFYASSQKFSVAIGVLLGIGLLVLLFTHIYLRYRVHLRLHKVATPLALLCTLGIGYLATFVFDRSHYPLEISNLEDYQSCVVRVKTSPEEKAKSIGILAEVISVKREDMDTVASGLVNIYLEKSSASSQLKYGDVLYINKPLEKIKDPPNPYQFNFRKYYSYKNTYTTSYLRNNEWISVGKGFRNPVYEFSYGIRSKLKSYFKIYFEDEAVRGVAQAIVFGYKADLDDEWMDAFSKTGTIHVLAVSGLHVGIIFILISNALFMKRSRGLSLRLKSAVVLLVLFGYCLLTGFAPSVSRASIMFGVVVIAKAWDRQSNIYNTLSFAALILLVIDPYNLFNVGFQFSFLAVLGIVYYKDSFRKLLPQSTSIGDKIVTLLSVSVAAQITTFPLGLYYFHQYPNLFMISNLIVIPVITIILYGGIFFSFIAPLWSAGAEWLADIISFYILLISRVVHYIQDLPYAFFEDVHITFIQMVLIYLFIVVLTITLKIKKTAGFVVVSVIVLLFLVEDYTYEESLADGEVVSFQVGRGVLVGFRQADEIVLLASQDVYLDENKLEFIVRPYLVNERINTGYKIIPSVLTKSKFKVGDITSLGNGVIWYENKSYLLQYLVSRYKKIKPQTDFVILNNGDTVKNE